MLNHALRYQKLGFSVIPLKERSKEPLIKWTEYQKRRATDEEIKKWWMFNPSANIGLVTGAISGLAVVDLDGEKGLSYGSNQKLVSSVIVKTGNGRQLYYRDTEGTCKNTVKKIADGVDTRGEGGFVVAPPSLHPNGQRYSWLKNVTSVESLPLFPAHIFVLDVGPTPTIVPDVKSSDWIANSLREMKDGNIDNTLFSILSRLRNDGYSESSACELLRPHAEKAGATAGHLEEKARNVWTRYEPKRGRDGTDVSVLSSDRGMSSGLLRSELVIHSPTNPDSLDQYKLHMERTARISEFPTGYPVFDKLTGGLRRTEILTIAARTGVGKTNWLIGPIRTLCESGKKVLLFSTEMSFDQIWSRYRATLKDQSDFARHQFYVCDEFAPNTARIEEALKQIQPDVFIFDHINNVGEEHHQLSEFMKGLKFLARKFNIPCIMTAQLNRTADWVENGERVPPRLSMIKGSGTIEEVSAQVLLLSETRVNLEGTEIVGVVDKNRWGDKGMLNFMLKKNPYRIEEIH